MIYMSHGVVPHRNEERISHALFQSEAQFILHLQNRPAKYVSLSEAILGKGDALTIDDATYGGFQAAMLARCFGHEVTWFVSGGQVQNAIEYYPFQLSAMLDECTRSQCSFKGRIWDVSTQAARRNFQLQLEKIYMRLYRITDAKDFLEQLAEALGTEHIQLERALRVVEPSDLVKASLERVDLQNHGWLHLNPQVLSEVQRSLEVKKNEEYLLQIRQAEIRCYAPPFGGHVYLSPSVTDFMLLADRSKAPGPQGYGIVNRRDLFPVQMPSLCFGAEKFVERAGMEIRQSA